MPRAGGGVHTGGSQPSGRTAERRKWRHHQALEEKGRTLGLGEKGGAVSSELWASARGLCRAESEEFIKEAQRQESMRAEENVRGPGSACKKQRWG